MWSFAAPWAFLLLPLPLAVIFLAPAKPLATGALRVPAAIAARFEATPASALQGAQRWGLVLPSLLWLSLLLAIAGPQRLAETEALPASSRDIMLTLDLSGSMERKDFALDGEEARRLDVVQRVAAQFTRVRAGDRLGLVVFAEEAFVAAPLSHDVEAVARVIEQTTIGIAGRSTGISDGLGLAMRRLHASGARAKVAILLSDGVDNVGSVDPRAAAALAQELGIRVHTIALGPRDTGDRGDLRNAVDAQTLAAISDLSGGRAFRVRTTEDLRAVGRELDLMEGSPTDVPPTRIYLPYWTWPAMAALLCAGALLVMRRRGQWA